MSHTEILNSSSLIIRAEGPRRLDLSVRLFGIIPVPKINRFYSVGMITKIGTKILHQGYHFNSKGALEATKKELRGRTNGS